jgi:hypothetical protein
MDYKKGRSYLCLVSLLVLTQLYGRGTRPHCVAGATHAEGTSAWLHPLNRRETRRWRSHSGGVTRAANQQRQRSIFIVRSHPKSPYS